LGTFHTSLFLIIVADLHHVNAAQVQAPVPGQKKMMGLRLRLRHPSFGLHSIGKK
jgi:hypothetical protein